MLSPAFACSEGVELDVASGLDVAEPVVDLVLGVFGGSFLSFMEGNSRLSLFLVGFCGWD